MVNIKQIITSENFEKALSFLIYENVKNNFFIGTKSFRKC